MSATTETRVRTPLPDSLELGEFTLLLHDETVESGAPLAAQIRAEIAAAFAKLDPVLSLAYELEITEIEVGSGSRKSKNKVRLKRKKGKTLREKLMAAVAAASMALGFMSTDFAKLSDNLDTACKVVITDCNLRGIKAEICHGSVCLLIVSGARALDDVCFCCARGEILANCSRSR